MAEGAEGAEPCKPGHGEEEGAEGEGTGGATPLRGMDQAECEREHKDRSCDDERREGEPDGGSGAEGPEPPEDRREREDAEGGTAEISGREVAAYAVGVVEVGRRVFEGADTRGVGQLDGGVGARGDLGYEDVVVAIVEIERPRESFMLEKQAACVSHIVASGHERPMAQSRREHADGLPEIVEGTATATTVGVGGIVAPRLGIAYDHFFGTADHGAHHGAHPEGGIDAAVATGEQQGIVARGLDAEGYGEFATREAARPLGGKGHVKIGVLQLELAYDSLRIVGTFVVDHDHFHRRRIVLIEDLRQERAEVVSVGLRVDYDGDGGIAVGRELRLIVESHLTAHTPKPRPPENGYQHQAQEHCRKHHPRQRRNIERV